MLRALAATDRVRFLRNQYPLPDDSHHDRTRAGADIETLVGAQLDTLGSVHTTANERLVALAQIKTTLEPVLGAAAVQVLHDVH